MLMTSCFYFYLYSIFFISIFYITAFRSADQNLWSYLYHWFLFSFRRYGFIYLLVIICICRYFLVDVSASDSLVAMVTREELVSDVTRCFSLWIILIFFFMWHHRVSSLWWHHSSSVKTGSSKIMTSSTASFLWCHRCCCWCKTYFLSRTTCDWFIDLCCDPACRWKLITT